MELVRVKRGRSEPRQMAKIYKYLFIFLRSYADSAHSMEVLQKLISAQFVAYFDQYHNRKRELDLRCLAAIVAIFNTVKALNLISVLWDLLKHTNSMNSMEARY